MNLDITIIMAIAIVEAMAIGVLLSDKLGLINKTEIKKNPSNNKDNTNNTKSP